MKAITNNNELFFYFSVAFNAHLYLIHIGFQIVVDKKGKQNETWHSFIIT